jgi:hypothetical protein
MMTDDPPYLYAVPLFYSVTTPLARTAGEGRSDLYSWSITSIPDYTLGEIPAPGVGVVEQITHTMPPLSAYSTTVDKPSRPISNP